MIRSCLAYWIMKPILQSVVYKWSRMFGMWCNLQDKSHGTYVASSNRDESSSLTHLLRLLIRLISDELIALNISTTGSPKCKWKIGGLFTFETDLYFWISSSKQLSIRSIESTATEVAKRTIDSRVDSHLLAFPILERLDRLNLKHSSLYRYC